MPGTDSALKNNFVTVTVKVLAALAHEFELRMAYLAQQLFLSTASGQYLALHASDVGIYRRPASAASGIIEGAGLPGTTYPAGIRFSSGGNTYVSTAPATAQAGGQLTLQVVSETLSASSNRDADGLLTLADPVLWPDLATQWAVAAGGLGGGADIESDESLRTRGLQRKRNPPGGGTLTDYERIALSVPGVARAWAFRDTLAPGFVVVFFLFEGRSDLIPLPADVEAVQAAIDAGRLIRVDDSVAQAPIAHRVDIVIHDLSADTEDVRAQIATNLRAMFRDRCRPGIPADVFILSRSWISETISQSVGEDRHTLVSPAADIVLTNGHFPVVGNIAYGS
jgi:uncharacterized phage protein gp47/JayE